MNSTQQHSPKNTQHRFMPNTHSSVQQNNAPNRNPSTLPNISRYAERYNQGEGVCESRIDFHVHLYGCLSPESIQNLAARLGIQDRDHARFVDFYANQYGVRLDWESLFKPENLSELGRHYLFLEPEAFVRFQAKINLPVVAFPYEVSKYVLEEALIQHRSEVHGIEYRTFLPHDKSDQDYTLYLVDMVKVLAQYEDPKAPFYPRLIVSIDRNPTRHFGQFMQLKKALSSETWLKKYIVGIDFCGFESSPLGLSSILSRIRTESDLDACVHVGEQIHEQYLLHSIRWVYEAARLGAHRLGHALALGYPAELKLGQPIVESVEQIAEHKTWLLENQSWLESCGYHPCEHRGVYTQEVVDNLTHLQNLIMKIMPADVAIEVCPTSNIRIGGLGSMQVHPVHRWDLFGIKILVGSDDPGMLATTLQAEHALLEESRMKRKGC